VSLKTLSARKKAQAAGENKYFTGKSCSRGHISYRYTKDAMCCQCVSEWQKRYRAEQADHYRNNRKQWISENIESVRKWKADWKKRNPAKVTLDTVNRNAAKLKRTPSQLNDGHLFEMECVYTYCAGLRKIGLDYQVDHIVPLRGKIVSGLHVPWNLQVIPGVENMSKGNKYGV
jgi:hypothetical protein